MATTTFRLDTCTLGAAYPCCHGAARFSAVDAIPREEYVRRCPKCGTKWTVTRTTLRDSGGIRLDRLEWETAHVDIHAVNRRALLARG